MFLNDYWITKFTHDYEKSTKLLEKCVCGKHCTERALSLALSACLRSVQCPPIFFLIWFKNLMGSEHYKDHKPIPTEFLREDNIKTMAPSNRSPEPHFLRGGGVCKMETSPPVLTRRGLGWLAQRKGSRGDDLRQCSTTTEPFNKPQSWPSLSRRM